MQYLPNPIPVKAIQYDGDNLPSVLEFAGDAVVEWQYCQLERTLWCQFAAEWTCTINPTDWLMKTAGDVVVFDDADFRVAYAPAP
jgi:hypothetical protein